MKGVVINIHMEIIAVKNNVELFPAPNEVKIVLSRYLPPLDLISVSKVFAFYEDKILLCGLKDCGWDIPGGNIKPGETPEDTVRRETMDETGVELQNPMLLGYHHINILAPKPSGYEYPYPESYQVFYLARIANFDSFEETKESLGGKLFTPQDALKTPKMKNNTAFFEEALKLVVGHEVL